jgi:hypothetical protein
MGIFCNQYHLNYSGNKLWAKMFQTSLVTPSFVLSSLAIHKFCDECHRHLSSSWLWSQFCENLITFSSLILLNSSMYNLFMLSLSTSIFSSVIAFCHFWCVICFSSLKESFVRISGRDSFRGEGCDSSCTCNTRYILLVWNMCLFV